MSAEPPQREDLVGQVLEGLYRVEKQLDRGGMGTVYLARHLRLGNQVVVKVPAPHAAGALDGRLEAEIDQLTELQHPHIVRVRDKVRVNGLPCAVLDYLPRGNLRQRMKELGEPMSPARTLNWLAPIAQALDHLHARQIVHRDVKPGNIVFDDADQAMLVDFGIAKVTGELGLTDTGLFPGSPQYMAPELEPTPAYDQFALATVAYECLTGRLPWDDVHAARLVARKQREDPVRADRLSAQVPRALADCVHRALARDPAARYGTCAQFAEAFRIHLPAVAPPRPRRPGKVAWFAAAAAVLIVAAALTWRFLPASPGEPTSVAPVSAEPGPADIAVVGAPGTGILRDLLLTPSSGRAGAELVVAARGFRADETPRAAVDFEPGDSAHIYARTTDPALNHLLALLIDAEDRITILYPENLQGDALVTQRWRRLNQVTTGPTAGDDLVLVLAAETPWTPLLQAAAPPPPGLTSGRLWTAGGAEATRLAEAIARHVVDHPWSRASEPLRIAAAE